MFAFHILITLLTDQHTHAHTDSHTHTHTRADTHIHNSTHTHTHMFISVQDSIYTLGSESLYKNALWPLSPLIRSLTASKHADAGN